MLVTKILRFFSRTTINLTPTEFYLLTVGFEQYLERKNQETINTDYCKFIRTERCLWISDVRMFAKDRYSILFLWSALVTNFQRL